MLKKNITVAPFYGNWAVLLPGKDAPVSTHNLKSEAIKIANQLAKRSNSKIVIENKIKIGSENRRNIEKAISV